MKTEKFHWGILSTARINRALIPHLQNSRHSDLQAVASRDLAKAQTYAVEKGIPKAYGSYEDLLADPEIQIIYNSLPNHLHAEWSIKALEAGKHVLCEKPIALTMSEMDAMIAAARRTGRVLTEAFMYRHHNQTLQIQKLVSDGVLGEIRLLRGHFSFNMHDPGNVRWDPSLGGGSLWDVGCYPVSFARAVLGQAPVEAFGWQENKTGVDTTFVGLVHFPNDVILHFDCSFGVPFRTEMEIAGSKAALTIPMPFKPDPKTTILLNPDDGPAQKIQIKSNPLYFDEVEDMVNAVLHGTPSRVTLEDSRVNTATLLALYRSAQTNRPVRIADL